MRSPLTTADIKLVGILVLATRACVPDGIDGGRTR